MLKAENITVGYGSKFVLQETNFESLENEIHGILGINGAGKTTFFRALNRDLALASGTCTLEGERLSRSDISFLETKPNFYPYMTGKEYLHLIAHQNHSFDFNSWNALFELPLDAMVSDYSTGMKKKIAFLGCIAMDRAVFILDEPFNGVDLQSNEKLKKIITRLKTDGKTILISSHMMDSLLEITDRISLLQNGKFAKAVEKGEYKGWAEEVKSKLHGHIDAQLDELMS